MAELGKVMKSLKFIIFLLLCSCSAYGQGGVPSSPIVVVDSLGRPRAGVTVTVCTSAGIGTPCTPLASIFTDAALTIPATNPTTTDGLGNLPVFYAAPGTYKYTVTGIGITPSGPFTATVAGTGGGNVLSGSPNTFTAANTFSKINGVRVVDGVTFAQTRAGLQAAINDAGANGIIAIPSGVSIVLDGTTITVPNGGVSIIGGATASSGPGPATLIIPNSNGDAFSITGGQFTMRNMEIAFSALSGTRTGAVFNLSSFAGQGIFENMIFQGDPTFNSGDMFFMSRTSSGSGAITYDKIWISNKWNTAWSVGTSAGTIASQHASHIVTFNNSQFTVSEFLLDTGVDTFVVDNSEIGNFNGTHPVIWCRNTLASLQAPRWVFFDQVLAEDHDSGFTTFNTAVQLDASRAFKYTNSYIASSLIGVAVGAGTSDTLISNSVFVSIRQNGVTVANGAGYTMIQNNGFEDIGVQTTNTYDIISVAANTTLFNIIGNMALLTGTPVARYGVNISGTSTNWRVIGNDFAGDAGTASLNDTSTGANKEILGNQSMTDSIIKSAGAGLIIGTGAAATSTGAGGTLGAVISSGTATMTTAAIAAGACGTTVTVSASGVATTDAISFSFNAAPAANPAELPISSWPTANNVNFQYCNPTAGSVTPNAATINWRVVR